MLRDVHSPGRLIRAHPILPVVATQIQKPFAIEFLRIDGKMAEMGMRKSEFFELRQLPQPALF
jgi:hypothetical protein